LDLDLLDKEINQDHSTQANTMDKHPQEINMSNSKFNDALGTYELESGNQKTDLN